MNWILSPQEISPDHQRRIGPKAYVLSLMAREGFKIPDTLILTVGAYNAFVNDGGLRERILLDMNLLAQTKMAILEISQEFSRRKA